MKRFRTVVGTAVLGVMVFLVSGAPAFGEAHRFARGPIEAEGSEIQELFDNWVAGYAIADIQDSNPWRLS
jgi:hypothetical protein